MNLFISNFRTETKVIAVVLFALLACELALRKVERSLSLDLQHIRALPGIARNLAKTDGLRILFLGNSFTRVTVDPEVFKREMKSHGFGNIAVERVHPDGTRINEWYYTFKTYFVEPHLKPDLLVVITGRAHLQDQPIDPSALGAYFSSSRDVPAFLSNTTNSLDEKMEFFLAHYSAAYANRRRIEPRVFTRIIPHYQNCIQRIYEARIRTEADPRRNTTPVYSGLEQLLDLGEKASIPIVIATVPMWQPYSIDPEVKRLVAAHQMTFIEANEMEEIDSSHFPDGYHIDQLGAEKYTRIIAARFAKFFAEDPRFQKAR